MYPGSWKPRDTYSSERKGILTEVLHLCSSVGGLSPQQSVKVLVPGKVSLMQVKHLGSCMSCFSSRVVTVLFFALERCLL